jgi:hypothetical protein
LAAKLRPTDFFRSLLEKFFPGTIAIPIAEALAPHTADDSEAITQAVKALHARANGTRDPLSRKWERVAIDATLKRYRERSVEVVFRVGALAFGLVLLVASLALLFGYIYGKTLVISILPLKVIGIDREVLSAVTDRASLIKTEIETAFPPRPYGWRRILPWNWSVDPEVPPGKIEGYRSLSRIVLRTDPLSIQGEYDTVLGLGDIVSTVSLSDLGDAVRILRKYVSNIDLGYPFTIDPSVMKLAFSGIGLVAFGILEFFRVDSMSDVRKSVNIDFGDFRVRVKIHSSTESSVFFLWMFPMLAVASIFNSPVAMSVAPVVLPFFSLLHRIIKSFEWPKNPLLRTVDEVAGVV